jgi:hypothetical protein
MASWSVTDGTPRSDACDKPLSFNYWQSPPHAGLALCDCNREREADWREVVKIGGVILNEKG